MVWRASASRGCLATMLATSVSLGCWNLPNLDDPFFASLLAGSRVWMNVSFTNALPSSRRIERDTRLLGAWNEVGDETATWTFEAAPGGGYRLQIAADGGVAAFEGTLNRLGPDVFLELAIPPFATSSDPAAGDREARELHAFYKLVVDEDAIRLMGISEAWAREMIEAGQLDIRHDADSETLLLITASESENAEFLRRYADDHAAFSVASGFELRR